MFLINCVCSLKYSLNICYKMSKLKLSITFTRVYLDFFEIFLFFANFVKEVNYYASTFHEDIRKNYAIKEICRRL